MTFAVGSSDPFAEVDAPAPSEVSAEDSALLTGGAFRLSPIPVALAVGTLIAVGLLSATSGAAGLPVAGVLSSLLDHIPLVDLVWVPAVIAHSVTKIGVKLFTKELYAHLPSTVIRLLAVLDHRVETVQVLLLSSTSVVSNTNHVIMSFPVIVFIV